MVTDKIDGHSYDLFYRLLASRWLTRQQPRILEIGVQYGLSMDYWKAMMPNAHLTGIDVEDLRIDKDLPDRMVVGDAYDLRTVNLLSHTSYDLIVDDGPHTLPSMQFACQHYAPFTAPGGAFVVEDIPNPLWVRELLPLLPVTMQSNAFVVDLRDTPGTTGSDDILLVALRPAV